MKLRKNSTEISAMGFAAPSLRHALILEQRCRRSDTRRTRMGAPFLARFLREKWGFALPAAKKKASRMGRLKTLDRRSLFPSQRRLCPALKNVIRPGLFLHCDSWCSRRGSRFRLCCHRIILGCDIPILRRIRDSPHIACIVESRTYQKSVIPQRQAIRNARRHTSAAR